MSIKISKNQTITKTYSVPMMEYTENVAHQIATAESIGMNVDKLASGPTVRYFSGIYSTDNFMFSLFLYSGANKILFITNKTQKLQFRISWEEFL